MVMNNKTCIASLQVVRAMAAILVLLFHVGGTFSAKLHDFPAWLEFQSGKAGVDLFFVLSGFVI